MKTSYIVTEDLEILMRRFAKKTGFIMPNTEFFKQSQDQLIEYLQTIFPEIILLKAKNISEKLQQKISQSRGITVSLDRVYNNAQYHLETNRIVDAKTGLVIGEAARPGFSSLIEQINKLPKKQHVVLVDDGCFSGGTLLKIYEMFESSHRTIKKIILGVLVNREDNLLIKQFPKMTIEAVCEFEQGVVDWVCERDFFIGVPLSGKTVGCLEGGMAKSYWPDASLPYCLPFGDPVKGASIPQEKAREFSRKVLELSRQLWLAIERCSNRKVSNSDIPRLPLGLARNSQPFVDTLFNVFYGG